MFTHGGCRFGRHRRLTLLRPEPIAASQHQPGKGEEGIEPLASFSRTPVTTSEFYPDFDRFVVYDRLPFLK